MLARALAHDLAAPATQLPVAQVHAEQIAGEQRRLVAAGAGPYLQVHVGRIGGIGGQQQDLELVLQARSTVLRRLDLLLGERTQLRVPAGENLPRILD